MKPYPFTIKKRIELDIVSPGALGYDIYVSIPTRGESLLVIGCQEHTLSEWLKRGEKIITDEMIPQYEPADLDEDEVMQHETDTMQVQSLPQKPDSLPAGASWHPLLFGGGFGWLHTPIADDVRRAEAQRIIKRRHAAIRAGEEKAHRAMVTLPLLIAAIQDELQAAGL